MMVAVDNYVVQAIHAATDVQDLHFSVQQAIELEFATIPVYLTAMLSLRPDANREIWNILHSVVIDEMLHFAIDCNLLIALGGRPFIANEKFIPKYPCPLPMSIGKGMIVGCERFSPDLVTRMFMAIEKPAFPPIPIPRRAAVRGVRQKTFATIGDFYDALRDKIVELGDGAFPCRDGKNQVINRRWFSKTRLFPIIDVKSAVRALDLIAREGEGTATSPDSDPGVVAHYYRFQQIIEKRQLQVGPGIPSGYSFSGPEIPFDPEGVWPISANQQLTALDPGSQAGRRAHQFAYSFTKLLKALEKSFTGHPEFFDTAMGLMFELKLAGQALCSTPAQSGGKLTGDNVGPVFEYIDQNQR
jgi:hypothetical protein